MKVQLAGADDEEARADALVAEAVGLLLEGLALDDTLTGRETLAVVRELAALEPARDDTEVRALAEGLARLALSATATVDRRRAISRIARERKLSVAGHELNAAVCLLERGFDLPRHRDLRGLPAAAVACRPPELERVVRRLRAAGLAVRTALTAVQGQVRPSAAGLDLAYEISELRHGGWLWGAISTRSDSARDRVSPHLEPSARSLTASDMADVLERVQQLVAARHAYDEAISQAAPWAKWLVRSRDDGTLREDRVAALRWLITEMDVGHLGEAERGLIVRSRWREVLSHPDVQRPHATVRSELKDRHGEQPLDRLQAWLTPLPSAPDAAWRLWARTMSDASKSLAGAALLAGLGEGDADVRQRATAVVLRSHSSFGLPDRSRVGYRQVYGELRQWLRDSSAVVEGLLPSHPGAAALLSDVRRVDVTISAALAVTPPPRGPLRVAIAGRTKAGKTTLRKVLTRDTSSAGVGRGAHRTTREAEAFNWNQLIFVDTPGVAAYDDDYDAETALASCRDSDAVVWVYAEALRVEEATLLQALLAVGKPVLAVYNAKWRVDRPDRLRVFTRTPGIAFRDSQGHVERMSQVAREADVQPPLVAAVHAGAAQALLARGIADDHPAWGASRVPELEEQMRRLLAEQAQSLRALRLADEVRGPLVEAMGLAYEAVSRLAAEIEATRLGLVRERHDVQLAVAGGRRRACGHLTVLVAEMDERVAAWARRADKDGSDLQDAWQEFLDEFDLTLPLATFEQVIDDHTAAAGALLELDARLDAALAGARVSARRRERGGWWRLAGLAVAGAVKNVALRLIGGRKALAKAGLRKIPVLGWALIAADAVGGGAKAVGAEVRRSQIDAHAWQQSAADAARRALRVLESDVAAVLDSSIRQAAAALEAHFDQTEAELDALDRYLASLDAWTAGAGAGLAQLDRLLVDRLLTLAGSDPGVVVAASRVPNKTFVVTVTDSGDEVRRALAAALAGCTRDQVVVNETRQALDAANREGAA